MSVLSRSRASMKAILVQGGKSATAKGLYFGDAEKPVPKAGEVLVKVKAFGLNRMDILQRQGKYPLPPGVTDILGVEASGTVVEVGAGESPWKVDDAVFGLNFGGCYAEYATFSNYMLTAKPESLSWEEAAAIPENWLTAWGALFDSAVMAEKDKVLIHAGASGVGLAAIQLAKAFGASNIIATAGTDEKCKFVESKGATTGVNYKTKDFAEEVAKLTDGKGVDVVVDFIGSSYWDKNLAALGRDGRMVMLGLMGGAVTPAPTNLAPILMKRLRVQGSTLRSRTVEYQSKLLQTFSAKAMAKVSGEKGQGLDLVMHKVYDWADIIEAQEEMEAAKNIGKIVCRI